MTFAHALPHVNGALNLVVAALLVAAYAAIRSGRRVVHGRCMGSAVVVGVAFLALYALQWALVPHRRFPGDDWLRALFVGVLGTHELMAVVAVPLVWRTVSHARANRWEAHRRLVRFTFPVWFYVAITGVAIYVLRNHVRPA